VRQFFPIRHELRVQAVPAGRRHQGLGPVVEVPAQHVVLGAVGAIEGEVEEAVRLHHQSDVRQALPDDLDRGVREDAVRVHHVGRARVLAAGVRPEAACFVQATRA
jgi:hypothetical protein